MDRFIRIVETLLLVAVVVVLITNGGKMVGEAAPEMPETAATAAEFQFDYNINREILDAIDVADSAAGRYASAELDRWIAEMMGRTDKFLDEYFSFKNVKLREGAAIYHYIGHKVNKNHLTASEAAMKNLEEEISRNIIDSSTAQRRIEEISNGTANEFMKTFNTELSKVQAKYAVPVQEWDRHIQRLCGITSEFNTRNVSVATKLVMVSGGVLTLRAVAPIFTKICQKIGQKFAISAGVRAAGAAGAASTAGAAGAAGTTAAVGSAIPIIGIGITAAVIAWDIYDYSKTADKGKRELRASFIEYFREMKAELMGPTENSIMGSIAMWENDVRSQIQALG